MEDLPIFSGVATVTLSVNGQPIVISINGVDAPITAGNFIDLVERSFYDSITFHRVVRTPTPFVVQAGDPNSRDPNFPTNLLGSGGFIDPATGEERTIPLEIKPLGATQTVLNQVISPPVQLPHLQGVISMARTDVVDSASSQFFITLAPQPGLDGRFAVFGNVTQGFEVVNGIRQGDRITSAKVTNGIIPSRESSIISDLTNAELLNDLINLVNRANLGLSFADGSDAANNIDLTDPNNQAVVATSPSGVRLLGGNDTLLGSPERDIVNGNLGNDLMFGNAGGDYFRGGQDNDTLFGGEGNDILNGNKGNDSIEGEAGNDFLRGGQNDDILLGGEGADTLIGDLGSDVLIGGLGSDTFLLRVDDSNPDRILDFDILELDQIVIIGNNLTLSQVQFELFEGVSTRIRLTTGAILGEVQNEIPSTVQQFTTITATTDAALRIG